jgi:hypothetical protein
MAQGGFLGRIGRAIRRIVAPSPIPRPPEEPPREREPRGAYRAIWREEGGKGSYQGNLSVFHNAIDSIEDDPAERLMLWRSYLKHINRGKGRFRRQDTANMFWRDSGIDPTSDAFNWAKWRQAMGYTGNRRSNTP